MMSRSASKLRDNQIEEYTSGKAKKEKKEKKTRKGKDEDEDAAPAAGGGRVPKAKAKGTRSQTPGNPRKPKKPTPPKPPAPDGKSKNPCIKFHKHNNCTFGDRCHFSHAPLSKAEIAKLPNTPPPSTKPAPLKPPPKREGSTGSKEHPPPSPKFKSKSRQRSRTPQPTVRYCGAFLKHGNKVADGGCDKGKDCSRGEHLTQEQLNKKRKSLQQEAKAKTNGGAPKSKGGKA